jgi:hypothetical protein
MTIVLAVLVFFVELLFRFKIGSVLEVLSVFPLESATATATVLTSECHRQEIEW